MQSAISHQILISPHAAVIHTETTRMWRVHATRETTVTTEDHAPAHAQHMQI